MDVLGMFAKLWRAGEVKTRLGATIGMQAAAEVHRQLVRTSLQRFQYLADRRTLAYAPADATAPFAAVTFDAWSLQPQAAGDFGGRIAHFFQSAFSAGAARALLIGSDSPNLPAAYLEMALQRLHDCDVVLGPADDGGYYSIGLKSSCQPLFADIAWSTADVLTQTLERCETLGLRTSLTPTWYDVDDRTDLKRLLADLACQDADADLRALRHELNLILADCPPL